MSAEENDTTLIFFSKDAASKNSTKAVRTNSYCKTRKSKKPSKHFYYHLVFFYVIFFLVLKFVFVIVFHIQRLFELNRCIYIVLDLCYPSI